MWGLGAQGPGEGFGAQEPLEKRGQNSRTTAVVIARHHDGGDSWPPIEGVGGFWVVVRWHYPSCALFHEALRLNRGSSTRHRLWSLEY